MWDRGRVTMAGLMVRGSRGVATSLLLLSLVSACGSNKEETQRGVGEVVGHVVKVGIIAPLSGSLSAVGVGIRNGADLAVRQANEQHKIKGWKVVLDPQDDQATPEVGANAAANLSDDK